MKVPALLIVLFFPFGGVGQTDTILSQEDFLGIVRSHHPLAMQARLWGREGEAQLQKARGNFDPTAFTAVDRKSFEDKDYYHLLKGGLEIPTWFGIEAKAGYKQNEGVFLDPQERTPDNGLYYARVSLPLGQGLFIDERRTELRKAKLFKQRSKQEKRSMLNELSYRASKAYWDWYKAHHRCQVRREALELAQERLRFIRKSVKKGARRALDSNEARVIMEQRRREFQREKLARAQAFQEMATFLWKDGVVPLRPDSGVRPMEHTLSIDSGFIPERDSLRKYVDEHPSLRKAQLGMDQKRLQARWAREQLKPKADVYYEQLAEPLGPASKVEPDVADRRLGLSFRFPLFLRSERGELKKAKVELERSQNRLKQRRRQLLAGAYQAYREVGNLMDRLASYRRTVKDLEALVEGERRSLRQGGSSVFMVNKREYRYIKTQVSAIKTKAAFELAQERLKYRIAKY